MIRHKQIQEANGMLQLLIDILADNGQKTIADNIQEFKDNVYGKLEKQQYEKEKSDEDEIARNY